MEGFGGMIPGSVNAVTQRLDIATNHSANPTDPRTLPPATGNLGTR